MQKPNQTEQTKKLNRQEFLDEAGTRTQRVKDELARLHGLPPCMFAVEVNEVRSWSDEKREAELSALRDVAARAERILTDAQAERLALWEQSDASYDDRLMPEIVQYKQIREDLEAYEDTLRFVRSLPKKH